MEATDVQIKKAYRKLSLKYHPDKYTGDEEDIESRFHAIARAYEVLSDPQKRQVYDLEGIAGLQREEQSAGRPSSPFDAFFGGRSGQQRGPDAAVDIPLTLEELYNGAQKQAQFSRNVICRKCRGTGAKGGKTSTCRQCRGKGHVIVEQQVGPGFTVQMQQPCPTCNGRGKTFKTACPFCHGHKVVEEDKVLTADVERGMPSMHQIVFERESEQHPGIVRAFGGVPCGGPGHQRIEIGRDRTWGSIARRWRHILVHVRVGDLDRRLAGVRLAAGEQLEQHDPGAVDVGPGIGAAGQHLDGQPLALARVLGSDGRRGDGEHADEQAERDHGQTFSGGERHTRHSSPM